MELLGKEDVTISSRKIAEMTNKDHKNVKRDIGSMLLGLELDALRFERTYKDQLNRKQTEYLLDKKHALCLATGYDVKRRMQILDYVELLEKQLAEPKELSFEEQVMKTISMAQVKIEALECKIEDDAPKVEFAETLQASDDMVTMAIACQVSKLPFGRNKLLQKLREDGYLISGGGRHNLPKQKYIECGWFTVNEGQRLNTFDEVVPTFSTYVSQKGINFLMKKYARKETV